MAGLKAPPGAAAPQLARVSLRGVREGQAACAGIRPRRQAVSVARCLTQPPQHSHVLDFQTSMVSLAAKAGEPNRSAKARTSNRIVITRLLPVWEQAYYKSTRRAVVSSLESAARRNAV